MNLQKAIPDHWPVLAVCGFSGSGKTTLVEKLIHEMSGRRLQVAVVKHDAHGMILDTPGKDTDRFFQAGASVYAHDPGQSMLRRPGSADFDLPQILRKLLTEHDLVIVEGHKDTPLAAKVWLESAGGDPEADKFGPFLLRLDRDADRLAAVTGLLEDWLPAQQKKQPLRAGILIGGRSGRMGGAKSLLEYQGRPWLDWVAEALLAHTQNVCLLGEGMTTEASRELVRLTDVPGQPGPVGGMLAAMRWDPDADWMFAACDMPLLRAESVGWLLDQRRPGLWAVIPRNQKNDRMEPLGAWYSFRMAAALAAVTGPWVLSRHPRTFSAVIPEGIVPAWQSFNTPRELDGLR